MIVIYETAIVSKQCLYNRTSRFKLGWSTDLANKYATDIKTTKINTVYKNLVQIVKH